LAGYFTSVQKGGPATIAHGDIPYLRPAEIQLCAQVRVHTRRNLADTNISD
jgi:hypothetical protein